MADTKPYVVVAEDDKTYGRLYLHKLTGLGLDVTVVPRGDQVLETLLKRKPNLLVLDLIMPGMDGFTVLENVRKTPELADLRVIVSSNLSQDIDKENVAKYNVYDYFVKSDLSMEEVGQKIRQALQA